MKFTKTAVALAVAGFVAMPMTASATTTLSGLVQIKMQGSDADGDAGDLNIAAGDVLFGITTDHTMSNGLTGYGSMRADFNSLSNEGSAQADSAYVGIKGGFGDLRFGEIPLAVEYGQLSNDIYDVGAEINGGISYTNSFGPASIILNYSPALNQDAFGAGIKFGVGGFTVGLGFEDRDEKANMSAGVSFAYAGASIGAHFATTESEVDAAAAVAADPTTFTPGTAAVVGSESEGEIVGVKVGYGIGAVSLGLTFMSQTTDTTIAGAVSSSDAETIRFDIVYDMGGDTELSSRVNVVSGDTSDDDSTDYRVQLTKFF